jgi:hypothetical protein
MSRQPGDSLEIRVPTRAINHPGAIAILIQSKRINVEIMTTAFGSYGAGGPIFPRPCTLLRALTNIIRLVIREGT